MRLLTMYSQICVVVKWRRNPPCINAHSFDNPPRRFFLPRKSVKTTRSNRNYPIHQAIQPSSPMLHLLIWLCSVNFGGAKVGTGLENGTSVSRQLGIDPITQNNPPGLSYQALFPSDNTSSIRGYFAGTSTRNGTGVSFNINIYGPPLQDSSMSLFSKCADQKFAVVMGT